MGKYAWSYFKNNEIWENCECDTVCECISEACANIETFKKTVTRYDGDADLERYCNCNDGEFPTEVYVGEIEDFAVDIDGMEILELVEQQAADFCFGGEDWDAYDGFRHNQEALDFLSKEVSELMKKWLIGQNNFPPLGRVINVKEYPLGGGSNEAM